MRTIRNLADVQIVLKELLDWKETLLSKAKDQRGHQIKNAGDATDPQDLVTLRQLQKLLDEIKGGVSKTVVQQTFQGGSGGGGGGNGTVTNLGNLALDQPVFGGGNTVIKSGTKSGNTNELASVLGVVQPGHYAIWDEFGNLIDGGAAGTVPPTVTWEVNSLVVSMDTIEFVNGVLIA